VIQNSFNKDYTKSPEETYVHLPFNKPLAECRLWESFWEHKLKELLSCLSQWLSQFPKKN